MDVIGREGSCESPLSNMALTRWRECACCAPPRSGAPGPPVHRKSFYREYGGKNRDSL